MLSARQYLNQPKDDAIIFSGPPRWDLADVDHKTQNTVSRFRASFRQGPVTTRCERRISQGGLCRQFGRVCCCGFVIYIWFAYTLCSICVIVVFVISLVFKQIVLDEMFVSFCLIAKYPWVLNKLSLNCGIGPGSPFGAKPFPKAMMT